MAVAADTNPPNEDAFYRETLKALGKELRNISGEFTTQRRLTGKLVDIATDFGNGVMQLGASVKELVISNGEVVGLLREIRDHLAHDRRGRTPTAGPVGAVVVARTQTGG